MEGFSTLLLEALARGTTVRFRAQGESMYPTIRDGEVITVAPVSAEAIARGDVLLCRLGHRVLAHRLVAISRDGEDTCFHLRGDAKGGRDAPVSPSDIVGRVISVARRHETIILCGPIARMRRAGRELASRLNAVVGRPRVVFCYYSQALRT